MIYFNIIWRIGNCCAASKDEKLLSQSWVGGCEERQRTSKGEKGGKESQEEVECSFWKGFFCGINGRVVTLSACPVGLWRRWCLFWLAFGGMLFLFFFVFYPFLSILSSFVEGRV